MFMVHFPPFPFGDQQQEDLPPPDPIEHEEVDWLPIRLAKWVIAPFAEAVCVGFLSAMYGRTAQSGEWWKQ